MNFETIKTDLRTKKKHRSGVFQKGVHVSVYLYGFQGQERDDEIKGKGNSLNYTYRMHDSRLGRFFAVDPLAGKYPWNSTYAFSENKVIHMVELEGLEAWEPKFAKVDVMSLKDFDLSVKEKIIPLAQVNHSKLKFDCNDLALFVVMKYFEQKGVEFNIEVNGKSYSSSDTKYKDFEQFFNDVRGVVGSKYTRANLVFAVAAEDAIAGDMLVSDNHTAVILQANKEEKNFDNVSASGYYYGNDDPRTRVEPLRESSGYYDFSDASSGSYTLGRWNMLSGVPEDQTPLRLEPKAAKPIPTNIDSKLKTID